MNLSPFRVVASLPATLVLCALVVAEPDPTDPLVRQYEDAQDVREVRRHVESIFEAFIAQDYETVRQTHTTDWRGIRSPNPMLVRTIDGYMNGLNPNGRSGPVGYEFLECEIDVEGDYASILYLARYYRDDPEWGLFTYLLRSIDTYRRDPNGWNQCGSSICVLYDDPPHVPTTAELAEFLPPRVRRLQAEASATGAAALEPVEPGIEALARSLLESLQAEDDEAINSLVTSDWKGYGVSSVEIGRSGGDIDVGGVLRGEATLRDLELVDIETQVRGDSAVAYFVATCRAVPGPGQEEIEGWLPVGALFRRIGGEWRMCTTHVNLIPFLGNPD